MLQFLMLSTHNQFLMLSSLVVVLPSTTTRLERKDLQAQYQPTFQRIQNFSTPGNPYRCHKLPFHGCAKKKKKKERNLKLCTRGKNDIRGIETVCSLLEITKQVLPFAPS